MVRVSHVSSEENKMTDQIVSAWELWITNHNGNTSRMAIYGTRQELDNRVKELVLAHGWSEEDLEAIPLFAEEAGFDVKRLREALENALTWEGRLNKASQLLSQGVTIEPSKMKIVVHAERIEAIALLEGG